MINIKIRLHNNDSTDYVDYTGDTVDNIRQQCAERIKIPTWCNGWSERISD